MVICFKKRQKIIRDEILEEKGERIYLEKQIKKLIKKRYPNHEINTNSSYIYQKMSVLLNSKIYMEARGIPRRFIAPWGYINVFDLHRKLWEIIKIYHLPQREKKIYTDEEKEYMKNFLTSRKINIF